MGIVVLLPYYLVRILIYQPRKVCSGEVKGFEERSMADAGRNRSKKKNQKNVPLYRFSGYCCCHWGGCRNLAEFNVGGKF